MKNSIMNHGRVLANEKASRIREVEAIEILRKCSECKNYFMQEEIINGKCRGCGSDYNHIYYSAHKQEIKEKNSTEEKKESRKKARKKFYKAYDGHFIYFYTIPIKNTEFEHCIYAGEATNIYGRHSIHMSLKNKNSVASKVDKYYQVDKKQIKGYALDLSCFNITDKQRKILEHYIMMWFKANSHKLFNSSKMNRYFTSTEIQIYEEVIKLLDIDYIHPKYFIWIEDVINSKRKRKQYTRRK